MLDDGEGDEDLHSVRMNLVTEYIGLLVPLFPQHSEQTLRRYCVQAVTAGQPFDELVDVLLTVNTADDNVAVASGSNGVGTSMSAIDEVSSSSSASSSTSTSDDDDIEPVNEQNRRNRAGPSNNITFTPTDSGFYISNEVVNLLSDSTTDDNDIEPVNLENRTTDRAGPSNIRAGPSNITFTPTQSGFFISNDVVSLFSDDSEGEEGACVVKSGKKINSLNSGNNANNNESDDSSVDSDVTVGVSHFGGNVPAAAAVNETDIVTVAEVTVASTSTAALASASTSAAPLSLKVVNNDAKSVVNEAAGPSTALEDGGAMAVDETEKRLDVNQMVQYVKELVPDINVAFLQEECQEFEGDQDRVGRFVLWCLEKKAYPKELAVANNTDGSIPSTSGVANDDVQNENGEDALTSENFTIERFLKRYPNPVKYFSEVKKYNELRINYEQAYLRKRYRSLKMRTIYTAFRECKYNLTLTCERLDKIKKAELKAPRPENSVYFPVQKCIDFEQEQLFIEHREEIVKYIEDEKEAKRRAREEAKEKQILLECTVCYNDELFANEVEACTEGHIFCKDCIRRGVETAALEMGKITFNCYEESCEGEFSFNVLQKLLKPVVFSKILSRKQHAEIQEAGIEGLETCPFCEFASIPPPEDKVFRCLNPKCKKESCRLCREVSHIPLRCDEVEKSKDVEARKYIEDKMTFALVRECPRCKRKFVKEDGCNKMTCPCGTSICYICRKVVRDYDHFDRGGNRGCPLYSDYNLLNVEAVEKAGKRAKNEVLQANGGVRLINDPTAVLPKRQRNDNYYAYYAQNGRQRDAVIDRILSPPPPPGRNDAHTRAAAIDQPAGVAAFPGIAGPAQFPDPVNHRWMAPIIRPAMFNVRPGAAMQFNNNDCNFDNALLENMGYGGNYFQNIAPAPAHAIPFYYGNNMVGNGVYGVPEPEAAHGGVRVKNEYEEEERRRLRRLQQQHAVPLNMVGNGAVGITEPPAAHAGVRVKNEYEEEERRRLRRFQQQHAIPPNMVGNETFGIIEPEAAHGGIRVKNEYEEEERRRLRRLQQQHAIPPNMVGNGTFGIIEPPPAHAGVRVKNEYEEEERRRLRRLQQQHAIPPVAEVLGDERDNMNDTYAAGHGRDNVNRYAAVLPRYTQGQQQQQRFLPIAPHYGHANVDRRRRLRRRRLQRQRPAGGGAAADATCGHAFYLFHGPIRNNNDQNNIDSENEDDYDYDHDHDHTYYYDADDGYEGGDDYNYNNLGYFPPAGAAERNDVYINRGHIDNNYNHGYNVDDNNTVNDYDRVNRNNGLRNSEVMQHTGAVENAVYPHNEDGADEDHPQQ